MNYFSCHVTIILLLLFTIQTLFQCCRLIVTACHRLQVLEFSVKIVYSKLKELKLTLFVAARCSQPERIPSIPDQWQWDNEQDQGAGWKGWEVCRPVSNARHQWPMMTAVRLLNGILLTCPGLMSWVWFFPFIYFVLSWLLEHCPTSWGLTSLAYCCVRVGKCNMSDNVHSLVSSLCYTVRSFLCYARNIAHGIVDIESEQAHPISYFKSVI